MSWERIVLALVIVAVSVLYYWLAAVALRDVVRRPSVRGNNKVAWALLIVCVPIVGALIYGFMGPASVMPRGGRRSDL